MRILLVSANTETINMRALPLGLWCVSEAVFQAGHQVRVVDMLGGDSSEAALAQAITSFDPEVVGVSIRNIDDQNSANSRFLLADARKIVQLCRAHTSMPIVLGGAGYSIFPQSALEYLGADMGIRGEGEEAFVSLLHKMDRGEDLEEVPGLYLLGRDPVRRQVFASNLDHFPLPSREMWISENPDEPTLWIPVQGRRGCPMRCSYCSTVILEGPKVRQRSVGATADWIQRVAADGFQRFYFVDNNFNIPTSNAKAICKEIQRRRLDIFWRAILNPVGVDEALVRTMAESGCIEVSLGFESGSALVLQALSKKFVPDEIRSCADLLGRYGIKRMGFLLLGGPEETRETVEESLAFADSLKLEAMRITAGIRIYPETPLAELAMNQGIIQTEDDLLEPRFYIVPGLQDWLRETLAHWKKMRPDWII